MFSEQVIQVNGKNIRYYEDGEPHRNTILFLHGGFGDAWLHWAEVIGQFADEYHLLAVDLPGYGQSDPVDGMTIGVLIDWLYAFLESLGIDQTVIVGQSFGGLIGRLFVAQYPQFVPALILVNGGVIPSVPGFAKVLARVPTLGSLLYNSLSRSSASRSSLEGATVNKEIITDDFMNRVQANISGLSRMMRLLTLSAMPKNRTPRVSVLMIWGTEDTITPLSAGRSIERNVPGAKFEEIVDCGHFPHLETQEIFVWQIRNFLDGLQRARGGS